MNLKLALAFSDAGLYARAIALFQPVFEVRLAFGLGFVGVAWAGWRFSLIQ